MFYDKQEYTLPPFVEFDMLNKDYWVSRLEKPTVPVLNSSQISKFNEATFENMKSTDFSDYMVDLRNYPDEIKKQDVLDIMNKLVPGLIFPKDLYARTENTEGIQIDIIKNMSIETIPDSVLPKPGILMKRSDVRSLPSGEVFTKIDEEIDMDRLQLTTLSLGSPVLILHRSADKTWSLVRSRLYFGWIKSDRIAVAERKEEIFKYEEENSFIVVTGSRIETEPNPFSPEISNLSFQMGDRIPLWEAKNIPESIPENNLQAQSPLGCYAISVPVEGEDGYLKYVPALIAGSSDVSRGYISYSRENIISQAFKMLGERYGWGGSFGRRDCSKFVMDIYRTVGIELPRDTGIQEKGIAGKTVFFSGSKSERLEVFEKLEPGDAIYMPGHVMLYIGFSNNRHYVIHDGAGYGIKISENELKPTTVHGVFVMDVETSLMRTDKTYLEAFTSAKKFR